MPGSEPYQHSAVSCPIHLWTKHAYRLVPPEIIGWSHIFHRLSSLSVSFFVSNYYFGLNLLKDSCKKGSELIGMVPPPYFGSLFAVSFYWIPLCPGTHITITWFTFNSAISFFIQSATSSDFVPLAPRATTATLLSMQIVACSFTSFFLRQLVTQSGIAATSAWKAVASCPSEMCLCILLWYLQIAIPVPYITHL